MVRRPLPLAFLLLLLFLAPPARAADFPAGIEAGALTDPPLIASNCERIREDGVGT